MQGSEVLVMIEQAIEEMPSEERSRFVVALAGKLLSIGVRSGDAVASTHGPSERSDRLLGVKEMATKMGKSADWVYRNWKKLPSIRVGGSIRFSERAIDEFITRQTRRSRHA